MLSVAVFIFCFIAFCFLLLLWQPFLKLVSIFFIIGTALSNYFYLKYNIYIDKVMLSNIFETEIGEAVSLITLDMLLWLFVAALLPALIIIFIKIETNDSRIRSMIKRLGVITILFIVCIFSVYPFYKEFAAISRNNRHLVKLIMPVNIINSIYKYAAESSNTFRPLEQIAQDAYITHTRKKLFILVLGETSRSQNFSLNGYHKLTNPQLANLSNIISFKHMYSCGTATSVSVPCMFSNMTRTEYSSSVAHARENILDIIQKAGYRVLWRENDFGCKGVCKRIPTQKVKEYISKDAPSFGGLYYDDHLLDNLDDFINDQETNTFIVLHTNGSHGPEYYNRYRPTLKHLFEPACKTNAIENCTEEELINVYDNTILQVDDLLAKTIQLLEHYSEKYEVAMLYVSDHGESLGEKGVYLHSAPYAIAPQEQKHIPMIFWSADDYYENKTVSKNCLINKAEHNNFSHDYLFNSLLSALEIKTEIYNKELDIFTGCELLDN